MTWNKITSEIPITFNKDKNIYHNIKPYLNSNLKLFKLLCIQIKIILQLWLKNTNDKEEGRNSISLNSLPFI